MRERSIGLSVLRSFIFSLPFVLPLAAAANVRQSSAYSGSREVRLEHGAIFDGRVFPAGLYSLSWGANRDHDRVEVRLYEGRRMVASATGRLEQREVTSPHDSILFSRARTGDRELAEIRFAGSPSVISLLDAGSAVARR